MSNIIELGKKLAELAKQGHGGEKTNAETMLRKLMEKHNITIEDIEGDEKKIRWFKPTKSQKQFFLQVVSSVLGKGVPKYGNRVVKSEIGMYLTDAEYIEIKSKFEFYWKRYLEDVEILYEAFVQKNRLYSKSTDNEPKPETELTADELKRLKKVIGTMDALDTHSFHKQIEQ